MYDQGLIWEIIYSRDVEAEAEAEAVEAVHFWLGGAEAEAEADQTF